MSLTHLLSVVLAHLVILTGASTLPAWTTGSQAANQPLVVVVRDGEGNPLPGVPLRILRTGPPHEPFDSCVTDEDGACRLLVPPGAYLIQFDGGWRGQMFVPAPEQNGGALDDAGAAGGGFGVYLEPGDEAQVVTFVIGQRDGQLVPLWDMSRDPDAPPQPFALPEGPFGDVEDALADVELGALAPGGEPDDGAQTVESQINPGGAPTPSPSVDRTPAPEAPERRDLATGVLGLVTVGGLLAGIALLLRALRRGKKESY